MNEKSGPGAEPSTNFAILSILAEQIRTVSEMVLMGESLKENIFDETKKHRRDKIPATKPSNISPLDHVIFCSK